MATAAAKHILIAPLDWGLGHTTRCIPLIRALLAKGHKVTAAGNEVQRRLLLDACPGISTAALPGYNVTYSATAGGFMFSLLKQLPRLLRTIREEHKWVENFTQVHGVDGIISDNRYGLYHSRVPAVIMTHQLQVKTGLGSPADQLARMLHYRYLNRFRSCWVADRAATPFLAGTLAHPAKKPVGAKYIGWLSQLELEQAADGHYVLILLSGPEPQRTIFARRLWEQAISYRGNIVFVAGAMQEKKAGEIPAHIKYYGRLNAAQLQPLIAGASIVICRSGYSTLMDLLLLQKKAVLIPTPGQTEQIYLAGYLQGQGIFPAFRQEDFSIDNALKAAMHFPFKRLAMEGSHRQFVPVLEEWVAGLGA